MKNFAILCKRLDEASTTDEKINLLIEYFKSSNPDDSVWVVYFLTGNRIKQIISARKLKEWSSEFTEIRDWLFDESYKTVGNLVETITLLLPKAANSSEKSLNYWIKILVSLRNMEERFKREETISAWNSMNTEERFLWNKLITGGFRMGSFSKLVVKALSIYSGIDKPVISSRLLGDWKPNENFFKQLISGNTRDIDLCKPYPFCLAYNLDDDVEKLGEIKNWQAEWKWSGIRSQIIKRDEKIFIWSHEEEMLNVRFPELESLKFLIPNGVVIDGNIIAWQNEKPLRQGELYRRIGKKNITKKVINDIPVVFMAHDLLELNNEDIRDEPLDKRSKKLYELISNISDRRLLFSGKINANSWAELREKRNDSRTRCVEGLILKRSDSPYCEKSKKGDWWNWKVDPLSLNAVLIYAQRGSIQHESLYTDFTFGVWDSDKLVPVAKTHSDLIDEEMYKINLYIQGNIIEKFGPVCIVKPELVFKLEFEDIYESKRHKSGVVIRSPKIKKWLYKKTNKDADNLDTLKSLIPF